MLAYVVFSSVTEKKLLDRGNRAFSPDSIKDDKDVLINMFGKMEIYTSKGVLREDELNAPIMWRFVAYLLMHKNQTNLPSTIYEAIWEDEDLSKAGGKVKAAAFRLQSAFSIICDHRLVISTPKGYQINPELNVITDVEQFEELWRQSLNAVTLQTKIKLLQDAVELYKEAIKVTYEGLGKIGYVANSSYTVIGDSMSAGRLYDRIGKTAYAKVELVTPAGTICKVCKKSLKNEMKETMNDEK